MITSLIEFINGVVDYPPQFEFLLYLGATALLLLLIVLSVDFFAGIFFAIFQRKR